MEPYFTLCDITYMSELTPLQITIHGGLLSKTGEINSQLYF